MDVVTVTPQHIQDEAPEAHAIMALIAEHMREQYPGRKPSLGAAMQAHAAGVLHGFLVLDDAGRPCGYLMSIVSGNLLDHQKTMQVVAEYVVPEQRGSKARVHLMQAARDKAQEIGCDWFAIERNVAQTGDDAPPWRGMNKASVLWRMEV